MIQRSYIWYCDTCDAQTEKGEMGPPDGWQYATQAQRVFRPLVLHLCPTCAKDFPILSPLDQFKRGLSTNNKTYTFP